MLIIAHILAFLFFLPCEFQFDSRRHAEFRFMGKQLRCPHSWLRTIRKRVLQFGLEGPSPPTPMTSESI
jgi:hypothetical protein